MRWFTNLSTGMKLFMGFGAVVVLLAVVAAMAFRGISEVQRSEERLFTVDHANAVDLVNLQSNLNEARADTLTMLIKTDRSELQALQQEIQDRSAENEEILSRLQERNRDDAEFIRQLQLVLPVLADFKTTRDTRAIPLILSGKITEAEALQSDQDKRYQQIRATFVSLGQRAEQSAKIAVSDAGNNAQQIVQLCAIVGAGAVLVAIVMSLLLKRMIANPLIKISTAAARIAAGDLTGQITVGNGRHDEVGVLSQTFGVMSQNVRKMMTDIAETANVLGSSASEIVASTAQLASSSSQTAAAVTETTTTMEEVRQTAQVASQKAKDVSDSSQRAAHISQSGKKSVDETAAGMNDIQRQMDEIAKSTVRLGSKSREVGQIITAVDDLAQQSNLLAVNAAIEAAKAGEQGKGFAVVAQEVKSLSVQSKEATAKIRDILNDIQDAISKAAMATEQGTKAVEAGVKQSSSAGESIISLAGSVEKSAQAASQIAASSQQQVVGIEQVSRAMESIKQASGQNVDSAKQLEAAAKNLNSMGQRLKEMVGKYKLQEGPA